MLLVLEIQSPSWACAPKTARIAMSSCMSPVGVLVPIKKGRKLVKLEPGQELQLDLTVSLE